MAYETFMERNNRVSRERQSRGERSPYAVEAARSTSSTVNALGRAFPVSAANITAARDDARQLSQSGDNWGAARRVARAGLTAPQAMAGDVVQSLGTTAGMAHSFLKYGNIPDPAEAAIPAPNSARRAPPQRTVANSAADLAGRQYPTTTRTMSPNAADLAVRQYPTTPRTMSPAAADGPDVLSRAAGAIALRPGGRAVGLPGAGAGATVRQLDLPDTVYRIDRPGESTQYTDRVGGALGGQANAGSRNAALSAPRRFNSSTMSGQAAEYLASIPELGARGPARGASESRGNNRPSLERLQLINALTTVDPRVGGLTGAQTRELRQLLADDAMNERERTRLAAETSNGEFDRGLRMEELRARTEQQNRALDQGDARLAAEVDNQRATLAQGGARLAAETDNQRATLAQGDARLQIAREELGLRREQYAHERAAARLPTVRAAPAMTDVDIAMMDSLPEGQRQQAYADFASMRAAYQSALEDVAPALDGRMTWEQLMDRAAQDPELLRSVHTVFQFQAPRGYAEGGLVEGALGYGAPPQVAHAMPEVREYRDYAMRAQQLGLPAIPFDQFAAMKAQTQGSAAPPQGALAFARGGPVPDVSGKFVLDTDPNAPTDSIPAVIDGTTPAALDSGEFVIPKDVVAYFGTAHLNKLIAQARRGAQEPNNG